MVGGIFSHYNLQWCRLKCRYYTYLTHTFKLKTPMKEKFVIYFYRNIRAYVHFGCTLLGFILNKNSSFFSFSLNSCELLLDHTFHLTIFSNISVSYFNQLTKMNPTQFLKIQCEINKTQPNLKFWIGTQTNIKNKSAAKLWCLAIMTFSEK